MLQNLKKKLRKFRSNGRYKNAVIFFGINISAYTFYLLTKLKREVFDSTPNLLIVLWTKKCILT